MTTGKLNAPRLLLGLALSVCHWICIGRDIAEGRLVALLTEWRTITLPIYAVHPSRRLDPRRVSALIEAIALRLKSEGAVTILDQRRGSGTVR